MKLKFWERPEPAPSGECRHLWSNWSEPSEGVATYRYETHVACLVQRRACLHCNKVELRQV